MNKTGKGKHWYNNGINEGYFLECPKGWQKGRLPVSEETRKKHSENNGMHHLSEEQKKLRIQHLHEYNQNKTEEQIKAKSEAISKATKGKNIGKTPWNKGKKGVQEAWNKNRSLPEEQKQKISNTKLSKSLEEKRKISGKLSESHKGISPWNKGVKTGPWAEETKSIILEKAYQTKKENHSFNISQPEENYKKHLIEKYGEENVLTQYKDIRYPFSCDFYIKSEDLFIELNLSWTHGGHRFDATNVEDIRQLERWQEKAKTSDFYKNAIETWTIRDIKKFKYAEENHLNYLTIYNVEEMYD